jgi:hypothetical protein
VIGPLNGPGPSPQAPSFVSREEAWGVVWRADMAPSAEDPGGVFRACAWVDADGQLQFFMQP